MGAETRFPPLDCILRLDRRIEPGNDKGGVVIIRLDRMIQGVAPATDRDAQA
ncbi:MAG: hypothetical protein ACE5OR_04280 [bacterium]